nr:MAG TPA: hypothetical protein [Ackermannviridae sp.]
MIINNQLLFGKSLNATVYFRQKYTELYCK